MIATINGVEFEGTPEEMSALVIALQQQDDTPPEPQGDPERPKSDPDEDDEVLLLLSPTLRKTYNCLPKRGTFTPLSIAKRMGISNAASSMRFNRLHEEGLIERIGRGNYRRVKV